MLLAFPEKFCYRHLVLSKPGGITSSSDRDHVYACGGFDRGIGSAIPCINFVSVEDVGKGICAYELRARNGFGESPVRTQGHHCSSCKSNSDSGKDTQEHTACTAYTPMLSVINGSCAWHLRSQRLVDMYKGDRTQLKPEELHCLEECSASKHSDCPGYIDIKHVVEQTCLHKVNLDNKMRKGGSIEGLESICAECPGKCNKSNCNGSYTSVTEIHHFEVWNDFHPLSTVILAV